MHRSLTEIHHRSSMVGREGDETGEALNKHLPPICYSNRVVTPDTARTNQKTSSYSRSRLGSLLLEEGVSKLCLGGVTSYSPDMMTMRTDHTSRPVPTDVIHPNRRHVYQREHISASADSLTTSMTTSMTTSRTTSMTTSRTTSRTTSHRGGHKDSLKSVQSDDHCLATAHHRRNTNLTTSSSSPASTPSMRRRVSEPSKRNARCASPRRIITQESTSGNRKHTLHKSRDNTLTNSQQHPYAVHKKPLKSVTTSKESPTVCQDPVPEGMSTALFQRCVCWVNQVEEAGADLPSDVAITMDHGAIKQPSPRVHDNSIHVVSDV